MATTLADADEAIVNAIRTCFVALIEERDDWRDPHVSDVYGCDYATHARRSSDKRPTPNRDAQGALKMALGTDVERYVANGLSYFAGANGGELERGERIAWNPETGRVRRGLFDAGHATLTGDLTGVMGAMQCDGCTSCSPAPGEIIGHLDATLQTEIDGGGEWLFEVKATSLFGKNVASLPWFNKDGTVKGAHYIEQAATYGVAIAAKRIGVLIVDRESGNVHGPFWLELDAPPPAVEGIYDPTKGTLREQTIARAKEMLERTDPDAFPPDPKPRYKWQPEYCNLGDKCACISKS